MNLEDVKKNLNKEVIFTSRDGWGGKFILSGCILRKNDAGFFYQAELQEVKAKSVCYCRLEDISEVNNA